MRTDNSIPGKVFRIILLFSLLTSPVGLSAQSAGGFPFFRSFLDGKTDHVVFPGPNTGGSVNRANKAGLVDKIGLRLTDSTTTSQIGVFYMPEHVFTTNDGMLIEFEYMMWGNSSARTDGICMFLLDAKSIYSAEGTMKYGAEGGGFGYTHRWAYSSSERIMGLKGGYVAIALDNGNFKSIRFEGEEQSNGIPFGSVGLYPARTITSWKKPVYNTRSNVTIRGAAGRGSLDRRFTNSFYPTRYMEEGFWGYPVLATRHTGWDPEKELEDPENLRKEANIWLDVATGEFFRDSLGTPAPFFPEIRQPFNISGKGKFNGPESPAYRKAIIALEPNTQGGGFKITVTIQHGVEKTVVIKDFTFPATLRYMENAFIVNRDSKGFIATFKDSPKYDLKVDLPIELVIGFAASTGHTTPYNNFIKNLRITPLYGASTANDDIYGHRRGPVTVRPLDNDIGYNGESLPVEGSKEYLDPQSFRFWPDEYKPHLDENDNAIFEYEVPLEGKWVYDPTLAEVMFFPVKGFTGEAFIRYDIKGKMPPFTEETFRSSLAKISVTIEDNQP